MNSTWIVPGDQRYDELKNSLNAEGSPSVIALCENPAQVAEALAYAKANQLTVSVRTGGHGFHGKSTNRGGVVIDVSPMNSVELIEPRVVRVGAGARWSEVADFLAPHQLAVSSGDTKQVGVAGLTLGGGIGWMVRKHGLAVDSLVAAELVLADGTALRVSPDRHEDLFWALRGGSGNFGVATAFEFVAQPAKSVFQMEITYRMADRESLVERWGRTMREAPPELSSSLTLFPGFPPFRPDPELRVSACFVGDEAAAHECYDVLCLLAPALTKSFSRIAYADILHDAPPRNPAFRALNRSSFVPQLSASFAKTVAANAGAPGTPITQLRALGGAMNLVPADATAFAHRSEEALLITVRVVPASSNQDEVKAVLDGMARPYAGLTRGAYLNFYNDTSEAAIREIYPDPTLTRLREVKSKYDPENVFRQTHAVGLD